MPAPNTSNLGKYCKHLAEYIVRIFFLDLRESVAQIIFLSGINRLNTNTKGIAMFNCN